MLRKSTPLFSLLIVTLFSLLLSACGDTSQNNIFDKTFTYTLPEIPFTIDASTICPAVTLSAEQCKADAPETTVQQDFRGNKAIETGLDIDIVQSNSEIAKYIGYVKQIGISKIEYQANPNTYNNKTPKFDVYIGNVGAKSKASAVAQSPWVSIPSIPAKDTASYTAAPSQSDAMAISNQLKTLRFSVIPSYTPVIEKGSILPPKGEAKIKVKVTLAITVNLFDAAGKLIKDTTTTN